MDRRRIECSMKVFDFPTKVKRGTPGVAIDFQPYFRYISPHVDNVLETMKHQTQSVLATAAGKIAKSAKRDLVCEREGKYLYHSEKPDLIVQEFVTTAAGNPEVVKKNASIVDLSILRNEISSYLFEYIEGFRIPTHFVSRCSDTEMFIRRCDFLPLSVRIYNTSNGALVKRLGFKDGRLLDFPIIEHYYADGNKPGTWANEYHLFALGVLTPEEFKQVNRIATKTNAVLRSLCDRRQLLLADMKLEFGRFRGQIILVDELSPLTCHFWDMTHDAKNGRDRFLPDQEQSDATIGELRDRLMLKV